jgi:hypothetical protein
MYNGQTKFSEANWSVMSSVRSAAENVPRQAEIDEVNGQWRMENGQLEK